jgi:hypothetical protein
MTITRPVIHIEHLTCLSYRAKQRIIASRPLLLPVIPYRRPFDPPPVRRYHRPIEIQRHPGPPNQLKPMDHHLPNHPTQLPHADLIDPCKRPRHRRYIRHPIQSHQPLHDGILPVIVHVSKLAVANQKMDYQTQYDQVRPKDGRNLPVTETIPKPLFDI